MSQCCGNCKWFEWPEWQTEDEDDYAFCRWPSSNLPYSLRYGARERLMIHFNDGADCYCFEVKEKDDIILSFI